MAIDPPFSGGCRCGAIRYSVSSEPRYMGNCHCRDCQQATGGSHLSAVGVKAADFKLEHGEPKWFTSPADKGHEMRRAFCDDCGSPVFLVNGAAENFMVLYAGSLDDPSGYEPAIDIYVKSAQPWCLLNDALPKFPEMPKR